MLSVEHEEKGTNVALILVDVMKCFYDENGSAYYPESNETLPAIRELLSTARSSNSMIVHSVERHFPDVLDHEQVKLPIHCVTGSLDCEYLEGLQPVFGPREIEIPKRRFSAFLGTDLALVLHANGIRHVVIAGVKTNVCIRATTQDAFGHGFNAFVSREATNSNRPHLMEASLEDISRYMGTVCSNEEALKLMQ